MGFFSPVVDYFSRGTPLAKEAFRGEEYLVLDFETFGLKPGSPVWQAALLDSRTGGVAKFDIKPFVGSKSIAGVLRRGQRPKSMEPWTRARYESDPVYRGAIMDSVSGWHPQQFQEELLKRIQGRNVLIANSRFESRQFGPMVRTWGNPVAASQQFETAPRGSRVQGNVFYVTGQETQALRAVGLSGNWDPLIAHLGTKTNQGFTSVTDIEDLGRAFISHGQRSGILDLKNSYTGTAVNTMSMAFGLHKYFGFETHLAPDDVRQEAALWETLWQGTRATWELNRGFIPAANSLLNKENFGTFQALKRLNSVRETLKTQSVKRSVAEALIRGGDADYTVVTGYNRFMAPMWVQGSPSMGEVAAPITMVPGSTKKALQMLSESRFLGNSGLPMDDLIKSVKSLPRAQQMALMHTGVDPVEALAQNKSLLTTMDAVGPWTYLDSIKTLARNYKAGTSVVAVGALTGLNLLSSLMSSDKNDRLIVDGLDERGISPELRKKNTQFGSGWQGFYNTWLLNFNSSSSMEEKIKRYKRTVYQVQGRRLLEEQELKAKEKEAAKSMAMLDPRGGDFLSPEQIKQTMEESGYVAFQGMNKELKSPVVLQDISPDKYNYEFDDADTLVLRKKNLLGFSTGPGISIRLAGIDAPEVGSHKSDPLSSIRIGEEQPGGQEARERFEAIIRGQSSLKIAYDPTASTYGRHIGILYGDQDQNINLSLVKTGSVAYLPFGESGTGIINDSDFKKAEQEAYEQQRGMWKEAFWQTYRAASESAGTRITFNTLTRLDKLAKDPGLTALFNTMWSNSETGSVDEEEAYSIGNELRRTYGRFNRKGKKNKNRPKSNTEGVNAFDGFQHQGMASQNRKRYGFGSPYLGEIPKVVIEQLKGERVWGVLKKLGSGVSGEAWLARHEDTFAVAKRFTISPEILKAEASGTRYEPPTNQVFHLTESEIQERWPENVPAIAYGNAAVRGSLTGYLERIKSTRPKSLLGPEWEAYSHKAARAALGDIVPESYDVIRPFSNMPAKIHVQEYAGISLTKAIEEGLIDETTWSGQFSDIIDRSERANFFHLDLHPGNIAWDISRQQLRPIDWAGHVERPTDKARERILRQHWDIESWVSKQIRNKRAQRMAVAQSSAGKSMFTRPIGHTKGGS